MTASFTLNFILQLCFALVCLPLLCPFILAAGLNLFRLAPPVLACCGYVCPPRRALGISLRLGQCGNDAAHLGIDAPSTDEICALCWRIRTSTRQNARQRRLF